MIKRKIVISLTMCLFCIGMLTACNTDKTAEKMEAADSYMTSADYQQAINTYGEILEKDSQNADAYIGLTKAYLAENKFEDAFSTLDKAFATEVSWEGTAYASCTTATDTFVQMLTEGIQNGTDLQQVQAFYDEIIKKDTSFKCTPEYLNKLATLAIEDDKAVLAVLDFCTDQMLNDAELKMDEALSINLLAKAKEVADYESDEDILILDQWYTLYKADDEILMKLFEQEIDFQFPQPVVKNYAETAKEKMEKYNGEYLIRHFFLDYDGSIKTVNETSGDYGVYDNEGKLLFDSATDLQDWNQDGLTNVTFYYDEQDRLIKYESSYSNWDGIHPVSMEFIYDNKGNLTTIKDGKEIRTIFKYDSKGRLTKVIEPWNTIAPYAYAYQYDENNKIINTTHYDIFDSSLSESQLDYSAFEADMEGNVNYTISTHASLRYAYAYPVLYNLFELSDGTKGYYYQSYATGSDYRKRFYNNINQEILSDFNIYSQGYFELNVAFNRLTTLDIQVEQVSEPAEKCINPHFAGKRYWVEDEYGIAEIVYDEYGLCDYIRLGAGYYIFFLKKYNEDGSIYECPVSVTFHASNIYNGMNFSIMSSNYFNNYSGYFYREFYMK